MWTTWRIEGLLWVAELVRWPDPLGRSSRPEDVRAFVAELPRWGRDHATVASLREMCLTFRLAPAAAPFDFDREIVPLVRDAIEAQKIIIVRLTRREPPAPGIVQPPKTDPPGPGPGPGGDKTWFQIQVTDEVGAPVGDIELQWKLIKGGVKRRTTDGQGIVRLEDEDDSTAEVSVVDVTAVRDKLRPRWEKPRAPKIPTGNNVTVRELKEPVDPVSVESETPAILVLTPRFRCNEIPGARFDFGRSFVLPAATAELAGLAAQLQNNDGQQGMVFGHSDISGDEATNKGLSERRAKAVLALLTHDDAAFQDMWDGKGDKHWFEVWGRREAQIMLNALQCPDDDKQPLTEDGNDPKGKTRQAIKRFQRGDYAMKPAEQKGLSESGQLDKATRTELFLAYAKTFTRNPVPAERFARIGSATSMGCGEYNPLSSSAKDAESRRVVLFVFDPAAAPASPPCKIGDIKPCQKVLSDPAPPGDGSAPLPYRCSFYRDIAKSCPCQGGADLLHDVLVRIKMPLAEVDKLPHTFILEGFRADNAPGLGAPDFSQKKKLSSDARALSPALSEVEFSLLPESFLYRLRAEGDGDPYEVFPPTPFKDLSKLSPPKGDPMTPSFLAIVNKPPDPDPFDRL